MVSGADLVAVSNADDERSSTLPLLTWTSIVDDRPSARKDGELFRHRPSRRSRRHRPRDGPSRQLRCWRPHRRSATSIRSSRRAARSWSPSATSSSPSIREATPVDPYEPQVPAASAIVLPKLAEVDQTSLPASPLSALAVSPLAVELPQRRKTKRRRRTGRRLVATLVFLCILIAGAVVFGRPDLFPDDWEANAEPYATAVEDVTGAEIAEPLVVTAEPTAAYQRRVTAQLAGEWQSQMPGPRASGSGEWRRDRGRARRTPRRLVAYPVLDRRRPDLPRRSNHAALRSKCSSPAAWRPPSFNQQFGWAIGQPERTLDDAALTNARRAVASQGDPGRNRLQHGDRARAHFSARLSPGRHLARGLVPAMYAHSCSSRSGGRQSAGRSRDRDRPDRPQRRRSPTPRSCRTVT